MGSRLSSSDVSPGQIVATESKYFESKCVKEGELQDEVTEGSRLLNCAALLAGDQSLIQDGRLGSPMD